MLYNSVSCRFCSWFVLLAKKWRTELFPCLPIPTPVDSEDDLLTFERTPKTKKDESDQIEKKLVRCIEIIEATCRSSQLHLGRMIFLVLKVVDLWTTRTTVLWRVALQRHELGGPELRISHYQWNNSFASKSSRSLINFISFFHLSSHTPPRKEFTNCRTFWYLDP